MFVKLFITKKRALFIAAATVAVLLVVSAAQHSPDEKIGNLFDGSRYLENRGYKLIADGEIKRTALNEKLIALLGADESHIGQDAEVLIYRSADGKSRLLLGTVDKRVIGIAQYPLTQFNIDY